MKYKSLTAILLTVLCVIICSCKEKSGHTIPPFPYEEYVTALSDGETDLGEYGDGMEPLACRAVYLELPEDLAGNSYADSLAVYYNSLRAIHSMLYDVTSGSRYGADSAMCHLYGSSLANIRTEGIGDTAIMNAAAATGRAIGADVARNYDTYTIRYPEAYRLNDLIGELYLNLSAGRDAELSPSSSAILPDYEALRQRTVNDSVAGGNELLECAMAEEDFMRRTAYAREYALWDMREHGDARTAVALIDSVLREGRYSPLLTDLWLIWRTQLQLKLLGGRSNDSPMYNTLYHEMKDRVALTYIRHLAENPDDDLAFNAFSQLTVIPPIMRQSACIFGNNANLDEMALVDSE